jgi:glycerol-3-phosphate dehydrogenase
MRRDITALTEKTYDLIVVGAGIFGICAAWDAAQRGLSVVLLERGDFAHSSSANHFKMIHGGIRYLQHADFPRVRESTRERKSFLRNAPHLARPLPIVIPTYGHGMQSKEILRAGTILYDVVTADRNLGIPDKTRQIPPGHAVSRQEALRMFPHLESDGLTGAVIFHDGQMYNPTRLSLAFLKSAVKDGADAANYLEVTDFLRQGQRVTGVRARDLVGGDTVEIKGRMVLNAAGGWAEPLLRRFLGVKLNPSLTFSRDACFVVGRTLLSDTHALAIQGQTKDPDAVLSRGNRHLFVVPWRGRTLVGVWHVVHKGDPDSFTVTEQDLQGFINEINASYRGLRLTLDDVSMWNAGLVLFGENHEGAKNLSYGKRSLVIDHSAEHRVDGLVSLIGVRYTTGRGMAEQAVDLVCKKMGLRTRPSRTEYTPVYGGEVAFFESLVQKIGRELAPHVSAEAVRSLAHNHGAKYYDVTRFIEADPSLARALAGTHVLEAEVVHAIRNEMALTLADVVFRRTDLATGGHPGEEALAACASVMARECGWDAARTQQELDRARAIFPSFTRPATRMEPHSWAEPVGV